MNKEEITPEEISNKIVSDHADTIVHDSGDLILLRKNIEDALTEYAQQQNKGVSYLQKELILFMNWWNTNDDHDLLSDEEITDIYLSKYRNQLTNNKEDKLCGWDEICIRKNNDGSCRKNCQWDTRKKNNKEDKEPIIESRHSVQPFIDWLIDNNKVIKSTKLYEFMEEYLSEWSNQETRKINKEDKEPINKSLDKLFRLLKEKAYNSEYHNYHYKEANQVIRAFLKEPIKFPSEEKKITFEKLDDGTCVISVSGKNRWGQGYINQDFVKSGIYEALKSKIEYITNNNKTRIPTDPELKKQMASSGMKAIKNAIDKDVKGEES